METCLAVAPSTGRKRSCSPSVDAFVPFGGKQAKTCRESSPNASRVHAAGPLRGAVIFLDLPAHPRSTQIADELVRQGACLSSQFDTTFVTHVVTSRHRSPGSSPAVPTVAACARQQQSRPRLLRTSSGRLVVSSATAPCPLAAAAAAEDVVAVAEGSGIAVCDVESVVAWLNARRAQPAPALNTVVDAFSPAAPTPSSIPGLTSCRSSSLSSSCDSLCEPSVPTPAVASPRLCAILEPLPGTPADFRPIVKRFVLPHDRGALADVAQDRPPGAHRPGLLPRLNVDSPFPGVSPFLHDDDARATLRKREAAAKNNGAQPIWKRVAAGFCENCVSRFSDMATHLMSQEHRRYASEPANFAAIDAEIGLLAESSQESEVRHS